MTFRLHRVDLMPKELLPGVLYVSEEFQTAAHLCPCGCGSKIRTPLGPTEWTFYDTEGGPTLWPSVGNWQKACRSHYFIRRGQILWRRQWSEAEVLAGRDKEIERRAAYYAKQDSERGRQDASLTGQEGKPGLSFWGWLLSLFRA